LNNLQALVTPTEPYVFDDHDPKETEKIAKDMIETMYKFNGVGLSGNQCGVPWAVFVMRGEKQDFACFNPQIVQPGVEEIKMDEACLSVPGMVMKINRPKHVKIRFTDIHKDRDTFTYTGLTARIFQHELDHLEGKLFFDGCSRISLERAINQAKRRGFDYTGIGFMKYARH